MLSDKLISLLETFTKYELNNFKKYLQSPFFNENKEIIKLYKLINSNLRSETGMTYLKNVKKQEVWRSIFPNERFNDPKFRRLCSDLTKIALGFLSYQQFKSNPLIEQRHLLEAINQVKLNKHFVGTVRQARDLQNKSELRNASFHFNKHIIEDSCHTHLERIGAKVKTFDNLESADYHLDCFYITKKLKNYCDALGYRSIFSIEANIQLFPSFLSSIEESHFLKEPSIKAYYLVVKMLLNPDEESYFKSLKSFLDENNSAFNKSELSTLYAHLQNYCIRTKINVGQSSYFQELFLIFKSVIEKEIIFKNGILDPQDYKNIITVGLHLGEYDWVEHFIQSYTINLPKANQDNALNYNLAKLYFHQEDYEKVIEQLREVEYKNIVYALGGKLMLLKTYYELKEYKPLDSLIDSFRIYLRRNRLIAKDVQQQYLNVLRFVRKLSSIAPYDKTGVQKLKIQIDKCKALADKKWILEKLSELE